MTVEKKIVTRQDRARLKQAVHGARRAWTTYAPYLDWLDGQLDAAQVVAPGEVPHDVITMHAQVDVQDLRSGKAESLTLVYPGEQDGRAGRISIFEPAGLALLGRRVGDVLGWSDAEGGRTAKVGKMRYQPEAAGDHEL